MTREEQPAAEMGNRRTLCDRPLGDLTQTYYFLISALWRVSHDASSSSPISWTRGCVHCLLVGESQRGHTQAHEPRGHRVTRQRTSNRHRQRQYPRSCHLIWAGIKATFRGTRTGQGILLLTPTKLLIFFILSAGFPQDAQEENVREAPWKDPLTAL